MEPAQNLNEESRRIWTTSERETVYAELSRFRANFPGQPMTVKMNKLAAEFDVTPTQIYSCYKREEKRRAKQHRAESSSPEKILERLQNVAQVVNDAGNEISALRELAETRLARIQVLEEELKALREFRDQANEVVKMMEDAIYEEE